MNSDSAAQRRRWHGLYEGTANEQQLVNTEALAKLLDGYDRLHAALELLAGDEYAGSLAHTIAGAALYEEPSRV